MTTVELKTLEQVQPVIARFSQALDRDLQRLTQHERNINRFERLHEYESLKREVVNSTRTLQQIKTYIQEIEAVQGTLRLENRNFYRKQIMAQHSNRARIAVQSFEDRLCSIHLLQKPVSICRDDSMTERLHELDGGTLGLCIDEETTLETKRRVLRDIQELGKSIEDLHATLSTLNFAVDDQRESIESVAQNVEATQINVKESHKALVSARRLAGVTLPLTGAIIGGAAAGPIGFYVGAKLGAAAGVLGGVVLGLTTGGLLKRRLTTGEELELTPLSPESLATADLATTNGSENPRHGDGALDSGTVQTTSFLDKLKMYIPNSKREKIA